jgi:hypothetical protein
MLHKILCPGKKTVLKGSTFSRFPCGGKVNPICCLTASNKNGTSKIQDQNSSEILGKNSSDDSSYFKQSQTFEEPRNQFQGIDSASRCSIAV